MSYVSRRMQKSSLGPRGRGMGGFVDNVINGMSELFTGTTPEAAQNAECLTAANAQSAQLLAKASDVSKNWNPTGLYERDQIQRIVQLTLSMLASGSSTLDKATAEPMAPGARDALAIKRSAVQRKMSDALTYTAAIGKAMQSGIAVIDAPGLKAWVVNSMIVAADSITAAYYVSCQTPWWVSALAAFQKAFDAVWGVVKQVAGVAAELGQAVLKIPDTVGQIWTMAKWASIGVLAWWAYENVPKHLKGA